MVGLSRGIFWSTWFFRCFIMLLIPFTVNCILLCTSIYAENAIFLRSDTFLIWIFFVVFIISVITFGFMICVIFRKAAIAAIVGSFLFLLAAAVIFVDIDRNFSALSYFGKILFCFLINANVGVGVNMLINRESFSDGMQFSNLFEKDIKMNFTFGELLIFMLFGSVLQLLITLYIERVFPGEFGEAQPWYFPFRCCSRTINKTASTHEVLNNDSGHPNTEYEHEAKNARAGIEICNISKKFGAKTAVNNLSLNLLESQITVLLGK